MSQGPRPQPPAFAYREWPLLQLLEAIARRSDTAALAELHANRTIARGPDGRALHLADYIALLHDRELRRHSGRQEHAHAVDGAYDLTIDKFRSLPGAPASPASEGSLSRVDCRRYFGGFLDRLSHHKVPESTRGSVGQDAYVAARLRGHIAFHFHLSLREKLRSLRGAATRYAWKSPHGLLLLWMPRRMSGSEKRQWLEENASPRPSAGQSAGELRHERARVQALIDRRLGRVETVGIDGQEEPPATPRAPTQRLGFALEDLIRAVAQEKSETIDAQRPAIRKLGAGELYNLVHTILTHLSQGSYSDKDTAKRFGLSPPTLSRFAGSRWRSDGGAPVPDLWRNLAGFLYRTPGFSEAVRLWSGVRRVARESDSTAGATP